MLARLLLAVSAIAASLPVWAAVPVSYSFDQPTSCGTYCYDDSTGTEFIDGALGYAGWGVGGATEWVGWSAKPIVNIDFRFAAPVAITRIAVGTTQDYPGDVVLPSLDVSYWDGAGWVLLQSLYVPESSVNDNPWLSEAPHGFLTLSFLNATASQWRVSARLSADGPWTFIDEVVFTAKPVPEPSTYLLLALGLAAVGYMARRRR